MDFDLIIVGGGLAGASLAVALQGTRYRIGLVETRPPVLAEGWDPRVYAVSPACAAFLQQIGVWQHLDLGRMAPVHAMSIRGDAGGQLEFSAYDSGLSELAWIVEAGRIHRELWETVKRQHNVTMLTGCSPQEMIHGADSQTIVLSDGRRAHCRLLVGADGTNSWVREAAGIRAESKPYGERGVVGNFRCEKDHRNRAFQWFRDDGILALLPLPQQMVSMVWSCEDGKAEELLELESAELARRVAEGAGDLLGRLEPVTPAVGFPLRFMRVESVVKPRLALIGDAAHAIHPLSGHGINLGFQDARQLADMLRALPPWRDPGDLAVLRGYARARAEEPWLLQYTTHGLNRLFGSRNPLVSVLRNVGLNLTDRVPVVRDVLVRYATSGRF